MDTICELAALIQDLPMPCEVNGEAAGVRVGGIALDSRQVKPGDIFVCLTGGNTDGHRYIPNAIQQGAAAIVGTQVLSSLGVPYLRVDDAREAMAYLAASFGCICASHRKLLTTQHHVSAGAQARSWPLASQPCSANRPKTGFGSSQASRRQARLRAFLSSLTLYLYLLLSLVVTALR